MKAEQAKQRLQRLTLVLLSALAVGLLAYATPLERLEYWFGDSLYVREKSVDNRIKIIGIDDVSLREMGPFSQWTRQQAADLLNAMNSEYRPAVVAFDINYFGDGDPEGDNALAEAAAKYDKIVMASYLDYAPRLEQRPDGSYRMNTMYVEQMEKPYEALTAVSSQGFTNTVQDGDNYVRRTLLKADWEGGTEYSFAWQVYNSYMESQGGQPTMPETDVNGSYGFDYTAQPGMYEVYSYSDVIAGRYDPKVFQGSIVLVGAYSSGMMDQYMVPVARNTVMNGVEVQANHVNALLDGRTYRMLPRWVGALLAAVLVGAYVWLVCRVSTGAGLACGAGLEVAVIVSAVFLYRQGFYWKCLMPVVAIVVVFLIRLGQSYLSERFRKRKILNMFRTYMAPQIVDELAESGNYTIELGGNSRDVAVLFVDIRGFTSMSEGLPPSEVVNILNRYLERVTAAIFKNEGMLDKFIGDAVMAVYNAPLNVEDYFYKAVRTGKDIIEAIDELNVELKRDFGREIACGVGVHCGKAVVGNIGCKVRMDYTAIGDTVNVAERLEAIARGGQVLISEDVYDQVKERFSTVPLGKQSLKGRKDGMTVYSVEDECETGASR